MYADNDVAKYYDDDLLGTYESRYLLFTLVLVVLCAIAIAVPLLVRAKRMGLEPAQCLAFEDSENGVMPAPAWCWTSSANRAAPAGCWWAIRR